MKSYLHKLIVTLLYLIRSNKILLWFYPYGLTAPKIKFIIFHIPDVNFKNFFQNITDKNPSIFLSEYRWTNSMADFVAIDTSKADESLTKLLLKEIYRVPRKQQTPAGGNMTRKPTPLIRIKIFWRKRQRTSNTKSHVTVTLPGLMPMIRNIKKYVHCPAEGIVWISLSFKDFKTMHEPARQWIIET